MNTKLLTKVIDRKQRALKYFTLEQMGISGAIGGLIGLILGEFYTAVLGSIAWQIGNCILYAAIGAAVGYFLSKHRKEDLQVEIMLLMNLEKLLK